MAFLGSLNGPRESDIFSELGYEYFGCTREQLENEIEHCRYAESREEVVAVHIDDEGTPYIIVTRPSGPTRLHLTGKWSLSGDVLTFTVEEKTCWEDTRFRKGSTP